MKNSNKSSNKNKSLLHEGTKKKRRWVLWCISFVLAFVFWLYVAGANDVPVEETYDLIEIQYDSSPITPYGLVVQSISIDTVNVTIMGSQRDIKGAGNSDISAKISLSGIKDPGEYSLPVAITTPDRTTVTHQTVETVTVTVDRPSEKTFEINSDFVELVGYTLDSGYRLGNHSVSASFITVKGPTRELDTVKSIKIRTANVGAASDGKTVAASIVLLDSNGREITSKNLSVSENANSLTVTLSVYMQKTVKLIASGKNGYFNGENFKVSPSEVVLKGSPDVLKNISSINVYTIDEIKTAEDLIGVSIDPYALPEGITTSDGKTVIENITVDVYVTGKVTERQVKLYPNDIEVDSTRGMKVTTKSITITVYLSASTDPEMSIPTSSIIAYVDARDLTDSGKLPLTLSVKEEYRDLIYLRDGKTYEVNVGIPEVKDDAPPSGGVVNPLAG